MLIHLLGSPKGEHFSHNPPYKSVYISHNPPYLVLIFHIIPIFQCWMWELSNPRQKLKRRCIVLGFSQASARVSVGLSVGFSAGCDGANNI